MAIKRLPSNMTEVCKILNEQLRKCEGCSEWQLCWNGEEFYEIEESWQSFQSDSPRLSRFIKWLESEYGLYMEWTTGANFILIEV